MGSGIQAFCRQQTCAAGSDTGCSNLSRVLKTPACGESSLLRAAHAAALSTSSSVNAGVAVMDGFAHRLIVSVVEGSPRSSAVT